MHKVTPDKISFLREPGKTVMHVLHPEKFEVPKVDPKAEAAAKKVTKKPAKKPGQKDDGKGEEKPDEPTVKYAEIDLE
jgi:hypothetical protein